MSSYKGRTVVLTLALGPPALLAWIHHADLWTYLGLTWPLVLLNAGIWAFGVYRLTLPYFFGPLRHLPTPPARDESWLFGVAGTINREPRGHKLREWIDTIPNDGFIFARGLLHGFPALVLTSPAALQEALVAKSYDFEKVSADRRVLAKFLGHGLIIAEGAEHKHQRKQLQPAFSGRQIHALVPLFWTKAREFTQVLADQLSVVAAAKSDGGSSPAQTTGIVDLDKPASRVTLDIIGLACLGRDFGALHNSEDPIVAQYEKLLPPDSGSKDILQMLPLIFLPVNVARRVPLLPRLREAADASHWLRILCRELMEAKRRDPELHAAEHADIIAMLLRSGQFSDDQLVDQVMTFLAAGHETTANALCWTMYLLATHPAAQIQLRAELQRHFGPGPAPTTLNPADLDALPYLSAIVSEQLRLWPVVPITGREASRDTTLQGQFIPKGTIVLMSPWAINRSTTHWGPTAEEFRPERWLAAEDDAGTPREVPFAGKSPYQNLTFLHGPRSCIGQAFSRAELKCLIVAMILRFRVEMAEPAERVETAGLITIKPKNGLRVRLTEV